MHLGTFMQGTKKFWEELTAHFPSYDKDRTEHNASNNHSVLARARCRAKVFTKSLPSNDIGRFTDVA
jgi:hypothetical protein